MTFEQLECFIAAVKCPTFFDAAESLHITQSSLSKQIQKMEKELNLELFDRSRRLASLTEVGTLFYKEALILSGQYHSALTKLRHFQTTANQALRIGTLPILSQYDLTGFISRFSAAHPEFSVSIEEAEEPELLAGLSEDRFDLLITRSAAADSKIHDFKVLAKDYMVVILSLNHPLAQSPFISLPDIEQERFILMPSHTSVYRMCRELFKNAGINPEIVRTARMESILSAVSLGEGISLFPNQNLRLFRHDAVTAVPLAPSPDLSIGIVRKRNVRPTLAVSAFIGFSNTMKNGENVK